MKTIGLAPNPRKQEAVELASELARWLDRHDTAVLATEETAVCVGKPALAASDEQIAGSDLLLVLGGDGTMLRWSRLAAPRGTPMLGVNFGQYGFITEIHPDHAKAALGKFLEGDYYLSERVVLAAVHSRNSVEIGTYHALNDVVVSKGPLSRMMGLRTSLSGKFIATYAADGIIVASPTGSTAYSLSAGGPVVHPNVSVLIITPICPHTLNARSLVVPDSETVTIVAEYGDDETAMMLTIDGQLGEHLENNDSVSVRKADFTAKLVQSEPHSFYDKLQTRLRWGERFGT
ncbi:MAG: hypothetical protein A2Z18_04075 [Armatimonadetes bacterium RBG_16_58_9]|nr:MAG: hypothetical protein A2Z18_04075 [Armatimonadetes bacterium RBG_16_58_9]